MLPLWSSLSLAAPLEPLLGRGTLLLQGLSATSETRVTCRNLVIILGDQLDRSGSALRGFDLARDRVWMAELPEESTHVWSHKARIALFLSAMRHFREDLSASGYGVRYLELGTHPYQGFGDALTAEVEAVQPQRLIAAQPGDHRVLANLRDVSARTAIPLSMREDAHFLLPLSTFDDWVATRKAPRLEHFYRYMRQQGDVLMQGGKPRGGRWNYDAQNRQRFGREGPGEVPRPLPFEPDELTREAIASVERHFPAHPGSLEHFDWPVTPEQGKQALDDFVKHRLAHFGPLQDAMWAGEPFLYHSRLSAALNLKLLNPRAVVRCAEAALEGQEAPLASVEGFVRQVLGWREFVRGLYWGNMPEYRQANALGADLPLPDLYWTAQTDMRCMSEAIGQTLQCGYAHHIQRLMVTGLFALLLGVCPQRLHEWYLAVYVDAVEWVELPNTLGMSQYADDGLMASKPYIATGKYIQRMSNYCGQCRYDPAQATGDKACPFTTLYWDFLMRHEARFANHPRAALQWRNLERLSRGRRNEIRRGAQRLRAVLTS